METDTEPRLRTYLTLSAGGDSAPDLTGERSAGPPAPALLAGRAPRELTRQEYAELAHVTESELRALWGDR